VLRKLLGGNWRKLHNEELHDFRPRQIFGGDQMEGNEIGGACGMYGVGGEEKCIQVLVGKPEGKRPCERPSCGWENSIKVGLELG
jgi:hypothetical protein